ncbi:hypothetical protein FRC12_010851 [Ceratobasidium sp. 428]|nr:hypothetical protein FRC12_010851 [Ceratobasidium sp. 428]
MSDSEDNGVNKGWPRAGDIGERSYIYLCANHTSNLPDSTIIDFGDSDICLEFEDTFFKIHRYILKKFPLLREYVQRAEQNGSGRVPILMESNGYSADDFKNTFQVLYASVTEDPFEFSPPVLISSLRISTLYGYSALRNFSITRLERASLSPIQRIQLARECNIEYWKEPAYNELCTRDETISKSEARVLRTEAFVTIARRREEEQRRRGRQEINWSQGELTLASIAYRVNLQPNRFKWKVVGVLFLLLALLETVFILLAECFFLVAGFFAGDVHSA